ncbi:MAG: GNAT family N-acetyltransferase [Verrucomicrobiota bacterium]
MPWDDNSLRPTIVGRIVTLEPIEERHVESLRAAAADERAWTWMTTRDTEAWIQAALVVTEMHHFVVVKNGDVIGSTSYLNVVPEHLRLEIGHTWNTPSAWGTGANTDAKYLLLRHAFEVLGARRVEFKTDAKNERARAALAAIPAEFEGIHRKHMLVRGGERRDSAWYAVIDDDWPAVKAALERRIAAAG